MLKRLYNWFLNWFRSEKIIMLTEKELQMAYTAVHGGLSYTLLRNIKVPYCNTTKLYEAFKKEIGFK